jgi:hypothetical protein
LGRSLGRWEQEKVEQHITKNWSLIGTKLKNRSGKECRERYKNQLDLMELNGHR